MSPNTKDTITYWHWMQEYRKCLLKDSKIFMLEIELPTFLTDVVNPKVARLMRDFIDKERKLMGLPPINDPKLA